MNYPIVPGRNLVTETAKELRLRYLNENEIDVKEISKDNLKADDIKNNIIQIYNVWYYRYIKSYR